MRKKPLSLTQEQLKAKLHYDPATGQFTWREGIARIRGGAPAGRTDFWGYVRIQINRKFFKAHRLAWLWMTGIMPPCDIDHVNCVKSDNRWANLRLADRTQQNANQKKCSRNQTGFKGTHFDRLHKRYRAEIMDHGKRHFLGYFDTAERAHIAYMTAARLRFGAFARAG